MWKLIDDDDVPFEMDCTACSLKKERYYINFNWLSLLFLLNKSKKK